MVKKLGYFVAALIFIVLAGAGWFFSGVIYEGALNPEFNDTASIGTAEDRVIVSKIDGNLITLKRIWHGKCMHILFHFTYKNTLNIVNCSE